MAEPMDLDEDDVMRAPEGDTSVANPVADGSTITASNQDEAERVRQMVLDNDEFVPTPRKRARKRNKKNRNGVSARYHPNRVTKVAQSPEPKHRIMTRSAYRKTGEQLQFMKGEPLANPDDPPAQPTPTAPYRFHLVTPDKIQLMLSNPIRGMYFFLPSGKKKRNTARKGTPHPSVTQLTEAQLADLAAFFNRKGHATGLTSKLKHIVETLLTVAKGAISRDEAVLNGRVYQPGDEKNPEFWANHARKFVSNDDFLQLKKSKEKKTTTDQDASMEGAEPSAEEIVIQGDTLLALVSRYISARVAYLQVANGTAPPTKQPVVLPRTAPTNFVIRALSSDDESEPDVVEDEGMADDSIQVHDDAHPKKNSRFVSIVDEWMSFVEGRSGHTVDTSTFSALSL